MRFFTHLLTAWLLLSPSGLVGAAIQPTLLSTSTIAPTAKAPCQDGTARPPPASGWIWVPAVTDTLTGASTLDAVFTGGKSLTIDAVTVNNRTVDADGRVPGGINLTVAATGQTPVGARPDGGGAAVPTADAGNAALADGAAASGVLPRPATAAGANAAARVAEGLFAVPASRLYQIHPDAGSRYLVETDPRFTRYAGYASSQDTLELLGIATLKRLGDGYFEQQLLQEQFRALTGRSSLGGHPDRNAEYLALLNAGVAAAQAFGFMPGLSLSQEQVARLTRNIVWMERRMVDGQAVLVPVVYLAGNPVALPAGNDPAGAATRGAILAGGELTRITATDINNSGLLAGQDVRLAAAHDLVNESGAIAGGALSLTAGNDLIVGTAMQPVFVAPGERMTWEGAAGRIAADHATLIAGRDLSVGGARFQVAGNASLLAGRDLALAGQTITRQTQAAAGSSTYERFEAAERTATFTVGRDLALFAGRDLTLLGSTLAAGGDLAGRAGRDLTLGDLKALVLSQFDASHAGGGGAQVRESLETLQGSALAGQNIDLSAGNDLSVLGSRLAARDNARLSAGRDLTIASINTARYHSSRDFDRAQSHSTLDARSTAQGSLVAAGGNLSLSSGGDTTIQGSALAAGRDLRLSVGGDLALLAAQRSVQRNIQSSNRKESLRFEQDQTWQLLSTITAGNTVDINVAGNLSAQTGSTNAQGQFEAERMTKDGVLAGAARQQVSLKGEGSGEGSGQSKVLGDLQSQGIRNGANDSFAPGATLTGEAAVQRLLQSGLIAAGKDPALQALLTPDGSTLTVTDGQGRLSLTVAGQAKVMEVYSQLRLNEEFSKHADQQTAQLVTLVVAIALTVCTGGAGAATLGGMLASSAGISSATTITMINAAIIGMSSTMVGQLAGGSAFDQAFEAGLKAGATSAMTAGVLNAPVIETASGGMQSINQWAGIQQMGSSLTGTFNAETFGQNLLGIGARGIVNASVSQMIYGSSSGGFGRGFMSSVVSDLAAVGANAVGQSTNVYTPQNVLGHAAVGAAAARLQGRDAAAGALGGATAALVNPLVDSAIGGADGSGWGSDIHTASKVQSGFLQLSSMASAAGIAHAAGRNELTAMQAAQNETLNNYLSLESIEQKQDRLAAATSLAERQAIDRQYAKLSQSNNDKAYVDLDKSATTIIVLQQTREKLVNALSGPISEATRADINRSISEIDGVLRYHDILDKYYEPVMLTANLLMLVPSTWRFGAQLLGRTAAEIAANSGRVVEGAMPNAQKAVIDPQKITSYALDSAHPVGGNKAKVFDSALGYNQSNAGDLMAKIQDGVRTNPAVLGKSDQFGQRFTVDMPVTGPNGNTATVRTGWIIDPGSTTPRLTTLYVK